ncbi:PAS domain S-box-containing protein [Hymenobacter gelipurpurascens]|uniref:histidine kinase n=1 Tax=Hymenobacter gelipurpurascens TaxID=89968 RepID=A0A212T016_9BACT|nr:PAS domain-containing sensor histidine kinase [Hymenobacter gelipurpurascens]SNC59378.1 PAS domain S-box-containing protein [Hymenobacter gelipurpurascens]
MNVHDVTPLNRYQGQNSEALFFLNPEGEFTFLSEPFARLTGSPAAALVGQSLASLLPAAEQQEATARVLRHAQQGEVLTFETELLRPGSQPQPVVLTLLPQLTRQALTGLVGTARAPEDATRALKAQGVDISLIFKTVTDIVFVLQVEPEEQYRFLFVNQAFEKVTGLTAEQVVGHLVQQVIPEPSLRLVKAKYRQALEQQEIVTWIEVSHYPTGQLVGEVSVTPVLDAAGNGWQLVGRVHDLTAQKRVEEDLRISNERFAYALKATAVALYDWHIAPDTLLWGEGFTALFGYTPGNEPPTVQQWAERLHPEDEARTMDDLYYTIQQTQQETWQQEYRFRCADGSWATVLERGCIIRDEAGHAVRMIGAMQNITERKEAEEKQRHMTQELFRQNADLQQFTYIISHNLRAPLANARGFADLLPRLDKNSDMYDKSVQHLQTSLQQLDAVITDVNTILSIRDRTELGRPEPVSLRLVCHQVCQTLAQALRECGGTVNCTMPEELKVPGERAYFYSIFYNLLANAVKYRSDARPLHVEIAASHTPEQGTVVTITDNGMGFDSDKAGNDVFRLYKRFHPTMPGRGLGLFLVKAHIEAMHGQVAVSSRIEEGTRFTLFFR